MARAWFTPEDCYVTKLVHHKRLFDEILYKSFLDQYQVGQKRSRRKYTWAEWAESCGNRNQAARWHLDRVEYYEDAIEARFGIRLDSHGMDFPDDFDRRSIVNYLRTYAKANAN